MGESNFEISSPGRTLKAPRRPPRSPQEAQRGPQCARDRHQEAHQEASVAILVQGFHCWHSLTAIHKTLHRLDTSLFSVQPWGRRL